MIGLLMQRGLRDLHEVAAVASGVTAQEILRQDRAFDVILCDLLMPGVSGADLYE